MLGKRSRPLLRTSSKLSFPHGGDCDQKTVNAQTISSKHPLLPQHVTVFGFDIPQETKPSDACESPRSVLDVNVVPSEKHPQGRSFRSCVRALPLGIRGNQGVGLAIIVDLHAEGNGNHGSLPPTGDEAASRREQSHHESNSTSVCLHHHRHQQSQPIAIAVNNRTQHQPLTYKLSKYVESPGAEDDDDSSSVGSVLDIDFFGSDCTPRWQEYVIHNKASCNADNDEDFIVRPSIFSVASIPASHGSFGIHSVSFLDACALCQRAFAPGKDIYMYRGDQAFCSTECRGERMKTDKYKEKLINVCAG